jgi:hypothetical protein
VSCGSVVSVVFFSSVVSLFFVSGDPHVAIVLGAPTSARINELAAEGRLALPG